MDGASLGALDIWTIFIDGIHFGEHIVLCALGVDGTGAKHVLGLWEGATENEVACKSVFGKRALVQRCQVHKVRNVLGHLPKERHADVRAAMREAYKCLKVDTAKRLLNNLARSLQKKHPGAAASLREGLDETLTVLGLGLTQSLARSLSTTNPVENMNGRIRTVARRVKRWNSGTMILRWASSACLRPRAAFVD